MKVKAIITTLILILTVIFTTSYFAQKMNGPIGQITNINGQALIRSKGTWKILNKAPYPIYNSDKIVTFRGRAEMRLSDGMAIIDYDSNLSINVKEDFSSMLYNTGDNKKQLNLNLLLGGITFKINNNQNTKYFLNTPSMKTEISGSEQTISATFVVNVDKSTNYNFYSGSLNENNTTGSAQKTANLPVLSSSDVGSIASYQLNEQKNRLYVQQAAKQAIVQQNEANLFLRKEKELNMMLKSIEMQPSQTHTDEIKIQIANLTSKISSLRGQTVAAMATADKYGITESLGESIWMNNASASQALKEIKNKIDTHINEIKNQAVELKKLEEQIAFSSNGAQALSISTLSKIRANSLISQAALTKTLNILGLAILNNDTEALGFANSSYSEIKSKISEIESGYSLAYQTQQNKDTLSYTNIGESYRLLLDTIANVSAIASSCSNHMASGAKSSLTNEHSGVSQTSKGIGHCNMSKSILNMTQDAVKLAEAGALDKVKLAFATTENILLGKDIIKKESVSEALKMSPITQNNEASQDETPSIDMSDEFEDNDKEVIYTFLEPPVTPPVDPLDLPMASGSK